MIEKISSGESKRRGCAGAFIEKARIVHGDRFVYDKTIYENAHSHVVITCREHGDFLQAPTHHLDGKKCIKCSKNEAAKLITKTFDTFFMQASEVHGDKYEYRSSGYVNGTEKCTIKCRIHGDFMQEARSHLRGYGCPSCAKPGFDPTLAAVIYCLKSADSAIVKVGISNYFDRRIIELKCQTPFSFSLVGLRKMAGHEAARMEKMIHGEFMSAKMSGFKGCTEWLRYDEKIISYFS